MITLDRSAAHHDKRGNDGGGIRARARCKVGERRPAQFDDEPRAAFANRVVAGASPSVDSRRRASLRSALQKRRPSYHFLFGAARRRGNTHVGERRSLAIL